MAGTAGNDTFVVDDTGDTVTEGVNQGLDTVQSAVDFTLAANVENLTLTGYVNTFGGGNGLDNVLAGNSGHNWLSGSTGRDTITGGAGDDTLVGGDISSMKDGVADSMVGGTGDDT